MTFIAITCGALAICSFVLLVCMLRFSGATNHSPTKMTVESGHSILTKVCWPLIDFVSVLILPLMSWGVRQRLAHSITQAGLSGWNYAQLFALQCLLGLGSICMVFCYFISHLLRAGFINVGCY